MCLQSLKSQVEEHENWAEYIIVSDGCERTIELMEGEFKFLFNRNFKLIKLPKQELHSGRIRQAGIEIARGEYITFVDSDDFIGLEHLYNLDRHLTQYKNPDFVYYNVKRWGGVFDANTYILKTKLQENHIGNGMITFRRDLNVNYDPYTGYRHDWQFIKNEIIPKAKTVKQLPTQEYFVRHIPGVCDI